jgi:hypothetical protein
MPNSLIIKHIAPRKWWHRTKYQLHQNLDTGHGIVPTGFETDGASIPRFLWWLFNPMGRYAKAAILHDYRLKGIRKLKGFKAYADTRKKVDKQFLAYMLELGVSRWRAYPMFWAVSLFSICVHMIERIKFKA